MTHEEMRLRRIVEEQGKALAFWRTAYDLSVVQTANAAVEVARDCCRLSSSVPAEHSEGAKAVMRAIARKFGVALPDEERELV